jgi:hypothetical protein
MAESAIMMRAAPTRTPPTVHHSATYADSGAALDTLDDADTTAADDGVRSHDLSPLDAPFDDDDWVPAED